MQKSSDTRYSTETIDSMGTDFISVECLEKLGLDQNPFIDHARDPFLFNDDQLEMSMNVLIDYLLNQNSTLVLLGEVGIGKTTHLRMLLRKGYQQFNFCTLRAKPKITFADIEEKIKQRWRIPQLADEDVSLLDINSNEYLTTDEHVRKYIEDDKHPVLIIDDAHRLQNNVLDELLKLKHHVALQSPKAMGLVLASEPGLKSQLAELEQTNPAATQIYQVNVRSFDASQCEDYLRYRMDKAGMAADSLFSSEIISDIYSRSKGLPKLINKLARQEISQMCEANLAPAHTANKLISSPSMRLSLILAGLVGLAVLVAVVSKNTNKPDDSNTVSLDINEPKTERKNSNAAAPDKATSSDPKSQPASIAKPYVAPLVLGPLQDEKPKAKDKDQSKISAKVEKPKTTTETKQVKSGDSTSATTNAAINTSDWILKQDPNAYTIQIVASPNENSLLDFAKKNSLIENSAYYRKSSADKAWYILVHGAFTSRQEALKSIEKLSDTLKKNTPYPIQIKYLHEVIGQQ